ncbi:MAG: VCBS repeat-containing protein [Pseudomonadota bacterium]
MKVLLASLSALLIWASASFGCTVSPVSTSDFPQSAVKFGNITAYYDLGSTRYPHGVLGDSLEPTKLGVITPATSAACGMTLTLNEDHVFEDLAPRLADLDGDGRPEVVTIRSHQRLGAQIAVYKIGQRRLRLVAVTPYIGTRFRWLAIVGIADLDGNGRMDIAFVDRPHLAKKLRVFEYQPVEMREVANLSGLTNHRIGEDFITSGIRACGSMARPEMVLADANWKKVIGVTLQGRQLTKREIGPFKSKASVDAALKC